MSSWYKESDGKMMRDSSKKGYPPNHPNHDEHDDDDDDDDDFLDDEPTESIEVDEYDNYYSRDTHQPELRLSPKDIRAIARKIEFCKEIPSVMANTTSSIHLTSPNNASSTSVHDYYSSSTSPSSPSSPPPKASGGHGMWSKLTSVIRLHLPKHKKVQTPPIILSFLVRDPTAIQKADIVARIHVYCNTGTVGVCRVHNDQVREMFFRTCSLKRVEQIMKSPPPLRNVRTLELFLQQLYPTNSANSSSTTTAADTSIHDHDTSTVGGDDNSTWVTQWIDEKEEQDLKQDLELLDVALAIVQGEKEDLANHVLYLEQYKLDQEKRFKEEDMEEDRFHHNNEDDKGEEEEEGYYSGAGAGGRRTRRLPKNIPPSEFSYSLPVQIMSTIDTWLQESMDRKDSLTCVTTNGQNTILVYASGRYYTTPTIPSTLQKILETKMTRTTTSSSSNNSNSEGRGSEDTSSVSKKTKIQYVSLGTNQRFFISFMDGECSWFGPKSLDVLLKDIHTSSKRISSLAFGQENSTYFIVYEDGSYTYSRQQGIPSGLLVKLKERKNLQDVACVSLGPEGEWFLKAKNGRMWWGGVSSELDDEYNNVIARKMKLKFVSFGEDGSYFMTFI